MSSERDEIIVLTSINVYCTFPKSSIVILFRKLFLVASILLSQQNPIFQLCMVLLVIFVAFTSHIRHRSYMSMSERESVLKDCEAETAELMRRLRCKRRSNAYLTNVQRLESEDIKKRNKERATNTAKHFWKYNTVERYLLGCAIIIILSGIMFESAFLDVGSVEYEALTNVTLGVITISLVYYGIVLFSKLLPILFPTFNFTFLQKNDSVDAEEIDDEGDGAEANPSAHSGDISMNGNSSVERVLPSGFNNRRIC